MKVDTKNSVYSEKGSAKDDFTRAELRRLRYLMRRLHFLEAQVEEKGGLRDSSASGGAAHAEWEVEALEFVLAEVGFLAVKTESVQS